MKIRILGRNTSVNVQAVMWMVSELGLDHTRVDVGDTFGGNDTADYLAKNPMGLVPVLEDGDVTLFESAAINRYLAAKYADDRFYPRDPAKRARFDVWAEWAKTTFYPVLVGQVFYPLVRLDPTTVDRAELDTSIARLNELATILDQTVQGGTYSDGDNLTFADIAVGHLLYRYFEMDYTRPPLPHLERYYETLQTREAYQEHVMISYEPLRWAPT